MSWESINFCVPLTREDKDYIRRQQAGEIAGGKQAFKIAVSQEYANMKQIIHNNAGYARPCEMVAVMGASGSGKTSLLNVLAHRLGLSPGAKLKGQIKCNGRVLTGEDFGKIGAFV